MVYQRHRNCRGGGVRDHRWFGLPSKEGIKVRDQEGQPLFNRFQGNVLSILPGYRYRQVLFAPSDTHEVVFAFLCERSARKYCSNDGFLEGMARSPRGEGRVETEPRGKMIDSGSEERVRGGEDLESDAWTNR